MRPALSLIFSVIHTELGELSYIESTQYTTANGNVVVGAYRLYALTGMLLPELGIKEDPLYESPRNQQEKR